MSKQVRNVFQINIEIQASSNVIMLPLRFATCKEKISSEDIAKGIYRVDEKYATASGNYQNKTFFGNPFYEFQL